MLSSATCQDSDVTPEPPTAENTTQQTAESIHQLAATVSQIAEQLQQVSLQLNQVGGQMISKPQTGLVERFSSLEDLVRQLSIRVSGLERREVAAVAVARPALVERVERVEVETAEVETEIDDEIEDEPDEILWDFIEPVAPGSQVRLS
jgi:phage-related minor tail protein